MSTFRNKMPIDSSLASLLCIPNRTGKKLPSLAVASSNTSSTRSRRAAAIEADECIQQMYKMVLQVLLVRLYFVPLVVVPKFYRLLLIEYENHT